VNNDDRDLPKSSEVFG